MSELFGLVWQLPWYGLTAIAVFIPILIHLLNRSRGKLVSFAHVALLHNTQPQPTAELRVTQRLLLLLRILLLLTAAALLAKPWWPDISDNNARIMLSQDWLNSASSADKQQLAKQLGQQSALLLDSPATPALRQTLDAQAILAWQNQPNEMAINLWAKIQSHAANEPPMRPLSVYTTNRANQFAGNKVTIASPLSWQINELSETNTTEPLSVLLIYQDARQHEVKYLSAALKALQQQSNVTIQITSLSDKQFRQQVLDKNQPKAQVVLWLSAAPLMLEIMQSDKAPAVVVMEVADRDNFSTMQQDWQLSSSDTLLSELRGKIFTQPANASVTSHSSQPIWQTTQDLAIMSQQTVGKTAVLQFYSRFDPEWNNLVMLPAFPLILGQLIQDALPLHQQLARSYLEPLQISHSTKHGSLDPLPSVQPSYQAQSDSPYALSLLLLLLFCVERLYSEKQNKSKQHNMGEAT